MSTTKTAAKGQGKDGLPCTAAEKPAYYDYVLEHVGETDLQRRLREDGEKKERPGMMASADEYQFLAWMAATMGAKRVIEVGVFRGVTTLALALALPNDAQIKALDIDDSLCDAGKKAWEEAGVAHKIEFLVGPATESMRTLVEERKEAGTYDFVFIDADKQNYVAYYEYAVQLVRVGGVIAIDNTLFGGRGVGPIREGTDLTEEETHYMPIRRLNELVKKDKRVSAVMNIIADGVYFVRRVA